MTDFEDAMQVAAARVCGARHIGTRNVRDYERSPIRTVSPQEALGGLFLTLGVLPLLSLYPKILVGEDPMRILIALCAVIALSGCASETGAETPGPACGDGFEELAEYSLFFGRSDSTGAEVVSDEAWNEFLEDTVTPRFPDGLTVMNGRGQWQLESGAIQRRYENTLYIDRSGRRWIAPFGRDIGRV